MKKSDIIVAVMMPAFSVDLKSGSLRITEYGYYAVTSSQWSSAQGSVRESWDGKLSVADLNAIKNIKDQLDHVEPESLCIDDVGMRVIKYRRNDGSLGEVSRLGTGICVPRNQRETIFERAWALIRLLTAAQRLT